MSLTEQWRPSGGNDSQANIRVSADSASDTDTTHLHPRPTTTSPLDHPTNAAFHTHLSHQRSILVPPTTVPRRTIHNPGLLGQRSEPKLPRLQLLQPALGCHPWLSVSGAHSRQSLHGGRTASGNHINQRLNQTVLLTWPDARSQRCASRQQT